ncbi:hypothetical protein MGSAQ_000387 [marine sediment metagenome]|uniref:Uncharacterized protein n=1 Tax=marine sediment metagenome TaxID=412755 RepID=A0A1B6NYU0_9ZZZZ
MVRSALIMYVCPSVTLLVGRVRVLRLRKVAWGQVVFITACVVSARLRSL